MRILGDETIVEVPYQADDVYKAVKEVVTYNKYHNFELDSEDETLKIIYLKTGVSLFSWGENIKVSIEQGNSKNSKIKISSMPKTGIMFGGAFDMGKNRKNVQELLNEISIELEKYEKIEYKKDRNDNSEQIEKWFKLKEKGIITEEEFERKKQELLK